MKILLAADGSDAAWHAGLLLAAYAGDRKAMEVTILHVQRPPPRLSAAPGEPASAARVAPAGEGERQLERMRQLLDAAGYATASVIRTGSPAEALLAAALAGRADLLLMGSGRRGILAGYAIGSVALRVAPAADCPVVLVKPGIALPAGIGLRVRVTAPVDGSREAIDAVRRLVACRGFLGEMHVDLVHFGAGLTLAAAMMPPHDDVLRHWSGRESDAALAAPARMLADAGIAHEVHRLTGEADTGIAAFAKARGADLIAMGSRGSGAMHHLFLGSAALRTAQLGDVPLALLR